jgi:hypothetical protein
VLTGVSPSISHSSAPIDYFGHQQRSRRAASSQGEIGGANLLRCIDPADVRFALRSDRFAANAPGMSASRRSRPNLCHATIRRFVPQGDICSAANIIFIQGKLLINIRGRSSEAASRDAVLVAFLAGDRVT